MSYHTFFALTASEKASLWQDLMNYFNDSMSFENIGSGTGTLFSLPLLVIGLFIGTAIAIVASVFNKRILGDFVRTLLREGCLSPESARDLDYLNYIHKGAIRYAVRSSTNLRRVVKCREEEEHNKKMAELLAENEEKIKAGEKVEKFQPTTYRPNPYLDHFYIPEDMKYTADIKFEKKGSSWVGVTVCLAVLFAALILVILFLPQVLKFVDNFIGFLKG